MGEMRKFTENSSMIYGVDITENVTPIMVRDAIIQCFYEAHCNVLELAKETFGHPPKKRFEEMRKKQVIELVHDIFHRVGGDFDRPTKDDLLKVVEELKKFASIYREPEVIKKNVDDIMILINKMD